MLNYRRDLLNSLSIGTGIIKEETIIDTNEEPTKVVSNNNQINMAKLTKTLEKIHIKEFNKKKKYITF
jgi:pantoate kinase